MERKLFFLHEKYSDKDITAQINKVILNETPYCFYILYPRDEIGDFGVYAPKFYQLSIVQLSEIKRAKLSNDHARITVRSTHSFSRRTAQVLVDYTVLFGDEFNQLEVKHLGLKGLEGGKFPWVPHARKIYYELRELPENKNLDDGVMALKVEEEMKKRFAAGDKNMVKRGGKKVPSASTILRHALQNI